MTRRRPDGKHELATRFQALALHDLLVAERTQRATSLEGGYEDDLVLRAHGAMEELVGHRLPTRFRLVKRIPAGAGLGGGSSDAAATLRMLVALHHLDVTEDRDLPLLAVRLGADVPFLLHGGAADATGLGEVLRPAPPATGWFALVWPGFEVPTGAVYAAWDQVGGAGENELERAAARVEPRLARTATALRERGAGWRMTGSGSAFFCHTRTRGAAEQALSKIADLGFPWTAVTRPVGPWDDGATE